MGASILSILAIVGVGLTYWFLQQKIDNQKRQARKIFEELEINNETRVQEAIKSSQDSYQTQLIQKTEELRTQLESQLQEAINSLQEKYQAQLTQAIAELKQPQNSQRQEAIKSLPDDELVQLDFVNEELQEAIDSPDRKPFDSLEEDSNLNEIELGNFGQFASISKIADYVNHPDSHLRKLAASALGRIAASQGTKAEIQRAVPLLGKLSRDSQSLVRQSAVEALGKIKSEKVIPLLSLALRDSDSDVVKIASAALNKYKYYPMIQEAKPTKALVKPLKR